MLTLSGCKYLRRADRDQWRHAHAARQFAGDRCGKRGDRGRTGRVRLDYRPTDDQRRAAPSNNPLASTVSTLTVSNSVTLSGAVLDFNFGASGGTTAFGASDLLNITGGGSSFTLSGGTLDMNVPGAFGTGFYKLIDYSALSSGNVTLSGSSGNNYGITINGFSPTSYSYSLLTPGDSGYPTSFFGGQALVLDVTPASTLLKWQAGTGTWDTTNANWTGAGSVYSDGSNVQFDDTPGPGSYTVTISNSGLGVSPSSTGSVNFANNAANYTFVGEGINGATGLTLAGTGTVTLNNINAYTGATAVNTGTLKIGDGRPGALTGSTSVGVSYGANLYVGSGGSLASATTLTSNGQTTFANASATQTIASLAGGAGGEVTLASGAISPSARHGTTPI